MSIRLEQVSVHQGQRALVRDCTLEVAEGERFALLGPEGSGKGALLRAISGTLPADHGRVLLAGRDVTRLPAGQRQVGIVCRPLALFHRMTVLENVEFALAQHPFPAGERRFRAAELLALAGLSHAASRGPGQLGAGEHYRAAVARALGQHARILLLEAPAGGFAPRALRELRLVLDRVRQQLGTTVLIATADPEAAMRLGDSIGVMSAGRVLEVGDPESLYLRPRTRCAARALGIANFLPGQCGRDGIRIGAQWFPAGETAGPRANAGEVTVLVRPEDVALADSPAGLLVPRAGSGRIERIEASGRVERVIVTRHGLGPEHDPGEPVSPAPVLVASRVIGTDEAPPLAVGQQVEFGMRRIHVLPSQLCSLWLYDAAGGEAAALARRRAVLDLSSGTQLVPRLVAALPDGAEMQGTALCVVAGWGTRGIEAVAALLERGARQVLMLREADRPGTRMLMLPQSSRAAREHMLSVSASVLRCLPMEAEMLLPDLPRPIRGGRYRMLLELRRAALDRHGIDVRTEIVTGDPLAGLAARLARAGGPSLLVLGSPSARAARQSLERLKPVLATMHAAGGVLVTCARFKSGARAPSLEAGHRDVA